MRLHEDGCAPILVTISSSHLVGMERVRERVAEIRRCLTHHVPWIAIRQPDRLLLDTSFYERTCLPCHHAYVVAGAVVAAKTGVQKLAFGYTTYQSGWPEQTPIAIERLTGVLKRHGIELALPVHNLQSRDEAVQELRARGLSTNALEQKCIQQVRNVELGRDQLAEQIDLWERAIDTSMESLNIIDIEVMEPSSPGE